MSSDSENKTTEEKVSENAKIILLALFSLVGVIFALASWVILSKPDIPTELLNTLFVAGITGAFTLGGVLIQTLWGK